MIDFKNVKFCHSFTEDSKLFAPQLQVHYKSKNDGKFKFHHRGVDGNIISIEVSKKDYDYYEVKEK